MGPLRKIKIRDRFSRTKYRAIVSDHLFILCNFHSIHSSLYFGLYTSISLFLFYLIFFSLRCNLSTQFLLWLYLRFTLSALPSSLFCRWQTELRRNRFAHLLFLSVSCAMGYSDSNAETMEGVYFDSVWMD